MVAPRHRVLENMLDRLYAAMSNGPAINCRPHSSRQRVDVAVLDTLDRVDTRSIIAALLSEARTIKLTGPHERDANLQSDSLADAKRQVLKKLRTIAEDAHTYEQDTGAQVLFIGFPLVQLPTKRGGGSGRILAPVALIPVALTTKHGARPSVEITAVGSGADAVIPNPALMAWIEQHTGVDVASQSDDEASGAPWVELAALTAKVCKALELPPVTLSENTLIVPIAKSDAPEAQESAILPSAVLGLFPLGNQNLVEDTKAMLAGDALDGPVQSFLRADVALANAPVSTSKNVQTEDLEPQRLVTSADPCQGRAVRLARRARGLVIHGPPGTGKSQTIANIIGDHLARGERVLFVCDKRGALDVVYNRLEHLGLGKLCAVVHDARRDQRDLYLGIREQLDGLPETTADERAATALTAIDADLAKLHAELSGYFKLVGSRGPAGEPSFHELTGAWLGIRPTARLQAQPLPVGDVSPAQLEGHEHDLQEAFERAAACTFAKNDWREAAGMTLEKLLARPAAVWRDAMNAAVGAAKQVDAHISKGMLPLDPALDLGTQAQARRALAERIRAVIASVQPDRLTAWVQREPHDVADASQQLQALSPQVELMRKSPMDAELALTQGGGRDPGALGSALAALDAYLAIARRWYAFFFFFRTRTAAAIIVPFGLSPSAQTAERVRHFLGGLRARVLVRSLLAKLAPSLNSKLLEEQVDRSVEDHLAIFGLLNELESNPALRAIAGAVRDHLAESGRHAALLEALGTSAMLADALVQLSGKLETSELISKKFAERLIARAIGGEEVGPTVASLEKSLGGLETLLRLQRTLEQLPAPLGITVEALLDRELPFNECWVALRKAVLAGELTRRLAQNPGLHAMDGDGLQASFQRYRALESQRVVLSRALAKTTWTQLQRRRLLATTGGRLNAAGAELRRRLFLRGERALRVRQVVAAGANIEGGDPLFDVRPVWMASPGTVAQIFPRKAIFDVVIFDEASQCRLEEALPVLARAKRVVIAGDPKQLPPTRFFESAVVQAQESEPEGDQELFENQQSDIEDLLAAALNLEVEQCYLDVHYRSANADLIAFSNESFYDSRLQPIPGHPSRSTRHAPIRLVAVNGTYDKRINAAEAQAVVQLVRELLDHPEPPSIGVACFNLSQRDAILEALDAAASADGAFAQKLAGARVRQGAGAFEGLFVKNLENVQGDERDHIIISTTYGPATNGRFYKRFGPLGTAGGGRRLNVLVTRARQQIHLLTSIPPELYRSLPPVPAGQTPNGAYLLMAYLAFAEQLERHYRERVPSEGPGPEHGSATSTVLATRLPSPFAVALGESLASDYSVSSRVHWGNEGFCVDVALQATADPASATIGVTVDGTRYDKADDALEWDLFQHSILEGQGWVLHRIWGPHFFRDPEGTLFKIADASRTQAEAAQKDVASVQSAPVLRVVH